MSVNQMFAADKEKTKKYGKYFNSIDFTMNPNLSAEGVKHKVTQTVIGNLQIGGFNANLNMAELERIIETLESAKEIFFKKYRLNRY